MTAYIGLIRKEARSDYGIEFPDFPGCITAAKSLPEAQVMAQEALNAHIEFMAEDGEVLPEPSLLEEIMGTMRFQLCKRKLTNYSESSRCFRKRNFQISLTM